MLQEAEQRYLGALLDRFDEPAFQEALRAAAGVCLVHLRQAAELAARRRRGDAPRRLARAQLERLQRLLGELAEVVRKHDYRSSGEPWGTEREAPRRAIEQVAGQERVR
jgi:hypothetical protein